MGIPREAGSSPSRGTDPAQQHSLAKFGHQVDPSTSRAWADHPGLRSSRDLPRALQRTEPTRRAPQGCFKTAVPIGRLSAPSGSLRGRFLGDPKGLGSSRDPPGALQSREQTGSALRDPSPGRSQAGPPESGWDPAGIPLSSAEADWAAPGQQCCLPMHRHSADPFPGRSQADPLGQRRDPAGIPPAALPSREQAGLP